MELSTHRHSFPHRNGIRVRIRGGHLLISGLLRIRDRIMDAHNVSSTCFTHQVAGQWE